MTLEDKVNALADLLKQFVVLSGDRFEHQFKEIEKLQRRVDDLKQELERVTNQKHDMHRERMGGAT